MGITYVEATVYGPAGERNVRLLVDSGATYTLLPRDVWTGIGLEPKRSAAFTLADGTQMERQISECLIVLPQGEAHAPVILGEEEDEGLLGVVTLENLGLVLNPFNRKLQPMRLLLA